MSYTDLLSAVAKENSIPSAADLVANHGRKYLHIIETRDRARELITRFEKLYDGNFKGKKILELGSGLGSVSIELSRMGAEVVPLEANTKQIAMAQQHAKDEAKIQFVKSDLFYNLENTPEKSFDAVFALDTLSRIYDLSTSLEQIRALLKPTGMLAFRVSNGMSPSMIDDRHGLGLPLLPPDYWPSFAEMPLGHYPRPWKFYQSLIKGAGFSEPLLEVPFVDESWDRALHKQRGALSVLKRKIKERKNLSNSAADALLRVALKAYIQTAERDIGSLPWEALNLKYRAPEWIGITHVDSSK
jgi:SAM-dependent methyltransferase